MSNASEDDRPVERSRLDLLLLLGGAGASAACLGGPVGGPRAPSRAPATTNDGNLAGGEGGGGGDGGGH